MHKIKWVKLLSVPILGLLLYAFAVSFAPYKADGSLNSLVILTAFSLLTLLIFVVLRTVCLLFRPDSANKIAFIASFLIVQILLVSSSNFLNLNSILIIAFFNLFIIWCALRLL